MTRIAVAPLVTNITNESIGTLGTEMFGVISQNAFGTNEWVKDVAEMGLQDTRFPGGTIAEDGWVIDGRIRQHIEDIDLRTLQGDRSNIAFDLTHPELISPLALLYDDQNHLNRDDVQTFSQMLERAVATDAGVSLIIPVQRYFLNQDLTDPSVRALASSVAEADIANFLERLKNGEFNNGEYPDSFRFEIGNELYSNPIEYALMAKLITDKISEEMADSGINYTIDFQMGRGSYEFNNLLQDGYFKSFFADGTALLPELSELDFYPAEGLPYNVRQVAIDSMMTEIMGDTLTDIGGNRHHLLNFSEDDLDNPDAPITQRQMIIDHWRAAYAELGIDWDDEVEYYYSAISTNTSNGTSLPFEMSGASNFLELYAFLLEEGVDRAAIWGVTTAFRYKDDIPSTTITDRLSGFDSPQKALLTLMTENVMGSEYLGSNVEETDGYRSFLFESDSAFTMFYYVKSEGEDGVKLDIDLGLLGDVEHVWVSNLDMAEEGKNGASRLTMTQRDVVGGRIDVEFDQDFEIVMVQTSKFDSPTYSTLALVEQMLGSGVAHYGIAKALVGTNDTDQMTGADGSDILLGGDGDDTIDGGTGRSGLETMVNGGEGFASVGGRNADFIFGGDGDDHIHGNAGNDLLSGDAGDDHLWGGSGFDTFVFKEGSDVIHDFQAGIDQILISRQLIDEYSSLKGHIGENTRLVDDMAMIEFGAGNHLVVHGVTDLEQLLAGISFTSDVTLDW